MTTGTATYHGPQCSLRVAILWGYKAKLTTQIQIFGYRPRVKQTLPHEQAGMVGRIIVATATGPGDLPFDYFKSLSPVPDWQEVPDAAQKNFPAIERILADGFERVQLV